jgi:hypothetical protein
MMLPNKSAKLGSVDNSSSSALMPSSSSTASAIFLAGLQEKVLHPDVIDYTFARFEEELARSMNRQNSEAVAARRQLQKIEAEIRNCTRAIASDGLSSFLRTPLASEVVELETQHRDLTEKLAASEPRAMRLRLRDTRRFVELRLQSLQSMFGGEPRLVRAAIAQHVQKITLTPEGRTYIASGTWNLLGSVAVTMVPGARIAHSSHGLSPSIPFRIEIAA